MVSAANDARLPVLSADEEHWAEVLAVERLYGARAHVHVAERIGTCALAGHVGGVERWRGIAHRLDRLVRARAPQ